MVKKAKKPQIQPSQAHESKSGLLHQYFCASFNLTLLSPFQNSSMLEFKLVSQPETYHRYHKKMSPKDWSDIIVNVLTILGVPGLLGIVGWIIVQYKRRQVRQKDAFPFEIVKKPDLVLPSILHSSSADPLAPHTIPYQQRRTGEDTQNQLRTLLNKSHHLLVHGPSGIGKTREIGVLARTLCEEGATVLILRREGWLDVPADWPKDLSHKNIVFIIDDINFHCSIQIQHPQAAEIMTIGLPNFRERLRRTLDWFTEACGEREIRVIVTARDEKTYWDKLQFSEQDRLWHRFTLHRLPEPEDEAISKLVQETCDKVMIAVKGEDIPQIASTNDRTFANVVANVENAWREHRALTLEGFKPCIQDTWRASYDRVIQRYPTVQYIYDALDLLIQAKLSARVVTVVTVGTYLWGGNWFTRFSRRAHLRRLLTSLQSEYILPGQDSLLQPRDGQIEGRGKALSLAEHFPEFVQALTPLLRSARLSADDAYNLITSSYDYERHQSGQLLEQGIKLYPNDVRFYGTRGIWNIWVDNKKAIDDLTRSINLDPKDPIMLFIRGITYTELKEYEQAVADYTHVIELEPSWAFTFRSRGAAYSNLGQYEKAIADFNRAIEIEEQDASAYSNRGIAYNSLEQYELAISDFNRAIELDPKDANAYFGRGSAYGNLKQYDQALVDFNHCLDLGNQDSAVYINRGKSFVHQNQFDQAVDDFTQALSIWPPDVPVQAEPFFDRGLAYHHLGEYEKAIADYTSAISLDAQFVDAYFYRAKAFANLGKNSQLIADLNQAIELDPQNMESYKFLGSFYLTQGQYELAIDHLTHAIELGLDENSSLIYLGRGFAYSHLKQLDQAICDYLHAIDLDPQNKECYYNLACTHAELGQVDNAIEWLEKAIQIDNNFREQARADADFDGIREEKRFRVLITT